MEVIRWMTHAQYMRVITHVYVKMCQKPEGIKPYIKFNHRQKMYVCRHTYTHICVYIKMDLKEMWCEDVD